MNKAIHFWAMTLLLMAICASPGCSTAGARFDTSNVPKITKGSTTKNEVRGYFGNPLRTEVGPNSDVWTYTYVETHAVAGGLLAGMVGINQTETIANTLTITFEGDVVKDFSFDSGSHTDTYIPR